MVAAHRVAVERRDLVRDGVEDGVHRLAGGDHGRQPGAVGIAAHHDHRLLRTGLRIGEPPDPEIAVRGQPAVERHLPLAGGQPQLRGAEIEEIGGDALLDLVCAVADERHQTGVRLADLRRKIAQAHGAIIVPG
ncbi:hypothetical protein [Mycolicibacterium phlei]|uniref:hypothetical protein n=1 Tax=Mycolicibacterium phlei TaxID=1771 RepID=UPI0031FDD98A